MNKGNQSKTVEHREAVISYLLYYNLGLIYLMGLRLYQDWRLTSKCPLVCSIMDVFIPAYHMASFADIFHSITLMDQLFLSSLVGSYYKS